MTLDLSLYEEGVKMAGYREQRIKFGTNHYPTYKPINPYERINRRIQKDISDLQITKERSETKQKKQKKRAKRIKIKEKKDDLLDLLSTLKPTKDAINESNKKQENRTNTDKESNEDSKNAAEVELSQKNINTSLDQKKTIRVSNVEPDIKKQGQSLIL